jgi:hypothetical protein
VSSSWDDVKQTLGKQDPRPPAWLSLLNLKVYSRLHNHSDSSAGHSERHGEKGVPINVRNFPQGEAIVRPPLPFPHPLSTQRYTRVWMSSANAVSNKITDRDRLLPHLERIAPTRRVGQVAYLPWRHSQGKRNLIEHERICALFVRHVFLIQS